MELEKIALTDEYFVEKKLYPNIDFYSGITLKALGFPTTMFTVLFAVARTVGWIAQWKEMIEDPKQQDRPPAPALYRQAAARLCRRRQPLIHHRHECNTARLHAGGFHLSSESTVRAASTPAGSSWRILSATLSKPESCASRSGPSRISPSIARASQPGLTMSPTRSGTMA